MLLINTGGLLPCWSFGLVIKRASIQQERPSTIYFFHRRRPPLFGPWKRLTVPPDLHATGEKLREQGWKTQANPLKHRVIPHRRILVLIRRMILQSIEK
jgi:hypothetical protein